MGRERGAASVDQNQCGTSAAMSLGGVALMVLPSLIVGNELLILGGVALAVGGWFQAHRHGELRGIVGQQIASEPSDPDRKASEAA